MFPLRVLFLVFAVCHAQPGFGTGSGGSGSTAATSCTSGVTTCSRDGTSNYMNRSGLTYDTATGKFSGSFVSNSCPEFYWGKFAGVATTMTLAYNATCYSQPIPATGYGTTVPQAAPKRGPIGFSISGGSSIYGPMEDGFTLGQGCTNNLGTCHSGTDVPTCEAKLKYECGTANFQYRAFGDDCGGHALPYHFHVDVTCTKSGYTGAAITGSHSPMTGVMYDGRALYGLYESGSTLPTDLDACGGHTGNVPATTVGTDTYPAATNVYHYHAQSKAPYVPACYGPVSNITACKALFSDCGTSGTSETFCTTLGSITYHYDCPCFRDQTGATYNQAFTLPCSSASSVLPLPLLLLSLVIAKSF